MSAFHRSPGSQGCASAMTRFIVSFAIRCCLPSIEQTNLLRGCILSGTPAPAPPGHRQRAGPGLSLGPPILIALPCHLPVQRPPAHHRHRRDLFRGCSRGAAQGVCRVCPTSALLLGMAPPLPRHLETLVFRWDGFCPALRPLSPLDPNPVPCSTVLPSGPNTPPFPGRPALPRPPQQDTRLPSPSPRLLFLCLVNSPTLSTRPPCGLCPLAECPGCSGPACLIFAECPPPREPTALQGAARPAAPGQPAGPGHLADRCRAACPPGGGQAAGPLDPQSGDWEAFVSSFYLFITHF